MSTGLCMIILFLMLTNVGLGDVNPVDKNSSQASMPYGVEEEWRACLTDSDCMAALRGCWVWEPINRKYIKEFMERNPPACLKSSDPGLQPVTACIDKVCKATDKTTNVKWDEWLQKDIK
jgi:hypothetical protein